MTKLGKRALDYLKGKKKSPEKEVIEPKEILDKVKEFPRVTWKDFLLLGICIVVVGVLAGIILFSVVNPVFPVGEILSTACSYVSL